MKNAVILLAEDNPRDEALTLRALRKSNIFNPVVVAHNGVEALDYLFGTGNYEGRDMNDTPELILLDLKMPKVDGLEVLQKIRHNNATKLVPVVVFTSSSEEEDKLQSYNLGANSYVRKRLTLNNFLGRHASLGFIGLF